MKRHACSTSREQQQRSWREMRISVFRVAKRWKRSKFASALNRSTDFLAKEIVSKYAWALFALLIESETASENGEAPPN
jgi:squalene cyclase